MRLRPVSRPRALSGRDAGGTRHCPAHAARPHVAEHFVAKIRPNGFKAMLVCRDRQTCALYKTALDAALVKRLDRDDVVDVTRIIISEDPIEDSALVSGAMRILFENAGRRVSVAASIAEALSIGSADPASLVLLDLTLPDGSGLTLVEPLLAAGCRNVVALTGHDDPETRERCLAAGCADVLVKPVPARELVARSAIWLD